MKLKLTDDKSLALPTSAITQTFGILAVRGAGKSNLAAVMAEEMWSAELPFVVIDPVGAWWGLRSSADGKEPGLPITIFGGEHADVPLERTGGQLVADLVVEQRLTCVLDVSDFSEGDKTRFLIDFAERLYRKNRAPLHLFLEEADDFIPQKPFREQARLVRAWENIVRRGRARGLGMTMITQRSAAINKNVLTQAETLFVLRTTSPQDRKAIEAWVDYHGQSREIIETLPGLGAGEAWVWSPSWLKLAKKVQIRLRVTYDSGATPKNVKGHRPPATLADVDIESLKSQMADTIERAQAHDPAALYRENTRLQRELDFTKKVVEERTRQFEELKKQKAPKAVKQVSLKALKKEVDRFEKVAIRMAESCGYVQLEAKHIREIIEREDSPRVSDFPHEPGPRVVARNGEIVGITVSNAGPGYANGPADARAHVTMKGGKTATATPRQPWKGKGIPTLEEAMSGAERPTGTGPMLTGPEQRILDALAWIESIGIERPEQTAVAFLAGYSAKGGAYLNPRGRLKQAGLIAYWPGNLLSLTLEGRQKANQPQAALTASELQERVLARLPGPEQKILKALLEAYPESLSNESVASKAGYAAGGGAYLNPRGRLRSLGLIEYRQGMVSARDILFLK